MENILNNINSRCVSLVKEETKRNNVILHRVIDIIVDELRTTDKLFKALYREKFYGGSYYDGLKVGNSTEFDIDLLLVIPEKGKASVKPTDKAGFVHVIIKELKELGEEYKGLEQLCDATTHQISARKCLSWVESLITKSFNKLCPAGASLTQIQLEGKCYSIHVKPQKSGPAFNMHIQAKAENSQIEMDVDLVPCFRFTGNLWPVKSAGYRQCVPSKHKGDNFLAVPKMPTDVQRPDFYWRLSFQEQEREMISGSEFGRLKPAIRLIKKVRDHWNHKIASYYIKTIFLWEVEKQNKDFWSKEPLNVVFYKMLKIYGEKVKSGSIEYYWNEKYNLISNMNRSTLDSIANKINNVVGEIERMAVIDPFVVAKHLVSANELELLRTEVDIGKKKIKPISETTSTSSVKVTLPSNGPLSSPSIFCTSKNSSLDDLLAKLKSDKDFKKMVDEMVNSRVEKIMKEQSARQPISAIPVSPIDSFMMGSSDLLIQRHHNLKGEMQQLIRKNSLLEEELRKLKCENAQYKEQFSRVLTPEFQNLHF